MSQFPGQGGIGVPGGEEEGEGQYDETPSSASSPINDSSPQNRITRHFFALLLRKFMLSVMPKMSMRMELADHGLKATQETPDSLLASENTRPIAARPTKIPFAQDNPDPRNLNPRRSLRVSR